MNDCFTLSAILKILDWGVYYKSFIFEISAILKEWNISLTTFFTLFIPFLEEKNSAILPKLILLRSILPLDQHLKCWSRGKIDLHQLRLTRVLSFVEWSGTRSALSEEGFNSLKGCELKNKYAPPITRFINKSRSNVQNQQNPTSEVGTRDMLSLFGSTPSNVTAAQPQPQKSSYHDGKTWKLTEG